jgi:hypothetical protein
MLRLARAFIKHSKPNLVTPILHQTRQLSTSAPRQTYTSSSSKIKKALHIPFSRTFIATATFALGSIATAAYVASQSEKKVPVIDKSIPKSERDEKRLLIAYSSEFELAGHKLNAGHSGGHKVQRINSTTGNIEYFYLKETFDREGFLNELIGGALARELCEGKYPLVLAHLTPLKDNPALSQYAVLSQSMAGQVPYSNLEVWAIDYYNDFEFRKYRPRRLGVTLAIDGLLGKTDSKLANLVDIWDQNGHCYSIDQESAFALAPHFFITARQALEFTGEFQVRTVTNTGKREVFNKFLIPVEDDHPNFSKHDHNYDPDHPLRNQPEILTLIEPILLAAIQNDFNKKRIFALYTRYTALTEDRLKQIVSQFGILTPEEQKKYFDLLKERQIATKNFLAQNKLITNPTPAEEKEKRWLSYR